MASSAPSGLGNHPSSDRVHRHGLGMMQASATLGGRARGQTATVWMSRPWSWTLRWSPHMPSKRMGRTMFEWTSDGQWRFEWSDSWTAAGLGVDGRYGWAVQIGCWTSGGAFRSDINRKGCRTMQGWAWCNRRCSLSQVGRKLGAHDRHETMGVDDAPCRHRHGWGPEPVIEPLHFWSFSSWLLDAVEEGALSETSATQVARFLDTARGRWKRIDPRLTPSEQAC